MGRLFYLMGKSASGKDTLYSMLQRDAQLGLKPLILYTTRPVRSGEKEGETYFFTDEGRLQELLDAGKVIELRRYHTVHGVWSYFTVDDGQLDAAGLDALPGGPAADAGTGEGLQTGAGQEDKARDFIAIGTLESYLNLRNYYGEDRVIPLYIDVEDGLRLHRALERERSQERPRYEEMCRRFLADQEDFSADHLREAGITEIFRNEGTTEDCFAALRGFILKCRDADAKQGAPRSEKAEA